MYKRDEWRAERCSKLSLHWLYEQWRVWYERVTSMKDCGQKNWNTTMPTIHPKKWAGKTTRKWLEDTRPRIHSTTLTGTKGALSFMKGIIFATIWIKKGNENMSPLGTLEVSPSKNKRVRRRRMTNIHMAALAHSWPNVWDAFFPSTLSHTFSTPRDSMMEIKNSLTIDKVQK